LSVSAQEATSLDWRPAGVTPLRLRAALDDGTTLPLELVAGEVAAAATAALPTHVFSGRRGKPLTIDLAALAGTETEAAALQWSRPLRGGRLERAEGGTLRYRPPGNFVGTDQFALRSPTLGELTVKVMVLP